MKGNIGVISYLDSDKTKHNWAIINGLNLEIGKETDEILSFAVKQSSNTSFIFVPKDGRIDILRSTDDLRESQNGIYFTREYLKLKAEILGK